MSLLQVIRDWKHERYIRRVAARLLHAMVTGDRLMQMVHWGLMRRAIARRSPSQVGRMERRMGVK